MSSVISAEHITRRVYSILDDRLSEVTREFMHAFVETNWDQDIFSAQR